MNLLNAASRLLFIGDSITDSGRREPHLAPLGNGYVRLLASLLVARHPTHRITILNRGIRGNTAEDLWSRWDDDVLAERPGALAVKIGINDANRHVCENGRLPGQTPESYERHLRSCLASTRAALGEIPILVISPFYLSLDRDPSRYRGRLAHVLPEYTAHARNLAAEFGATFLETQTAFDRVLAHRPPSDLSHDMIHLNDAGVAVLAEAVFAALFPKSA